MMHYPVTTHKRRPAPGPPRRVGSLIVRQRLRVGLYGSAAVRAHLDLHLLLGGRVVGW